MLINYILIILMVIMGGGTETSPSGGAFLDIYLSTRNVHFVLCAPPFLKHAQKWGCDHNAHKTHFRHQKHVTDFFEVGGKNDRSVI